MTRRIYFIVAIIVLAGCYYTYTASGSSFISMWLTPAQQYQKFINKQEYRQAAEAALDPMQKGTALYLDGRFKEAAAVFGAISTPEAAFNRGNSFMMLGKYDTAIDSYEKALFTKPDWNEAIENLNIARLRKEKMAPPEDDYGGTGGQLEADEIVIGDRKPGESSGTDSAETEQSSLSENEQRALWLRKVQTRPADFLRLKFSYQLNLREQ